MQNYDYVILFDENGQPYVAHSVWGRVKSGAKKVAGRAASAGKTAHKYLLKVGEGAKARYAYTKEEVDALMGRGRKAAGEAVEKGKSAVKSAAKTGREALKTAGAKTREKTRDLMGYDERERYQAAQAATKAAQNKAAATRAEQARNNEEYWETVNANGHSGRGVSPERLNESYSEIVSRANRDERNAEHARWYDEAAAYQAYAKTPLGMLDRAKENLTPATKAIKGYGKTAIDKIKDAVGFDERDARDAARRAYAEANDRAHVARDEADAATRKLRNASSEVDAIIQEQRDAFASMQAAKEAVEVVRNRLKDASDAHKVAANTRDMYKRQYENLGDDFVDKIALAFSSGRREDREKAYQAFVDAGMKAADARVAEEQAWRAFKAAQRKYDESKDAFVKTAVDYGDADDRYEAARQARGEALERSDRAMLDRAEADLAARRAESAYSSTLLGRAESAAGTVKEKVESAKEITASQARKLQEKLASGKELAQDEFNQLMSFLMKGYK